MSKNMDKLEWNNNALSLMEYIGIIESIYIPDLEDYDYRINVTRCEASAEAIEEAGNIPLVLQTVWSYLKTDSTKDY